MAERPILFSAPMVRALLAGTKTQTRRIIKLPPAPNHLGQWEPFWFGGDGCKDSRGHPVSGRWTIGHSRTGAIVGCHYGAGDRLWVREAWKAHTTFDHLPPREIPQSHVWYMADDGYKAESRFRQGMFMPRWASRITLEVTGVRVERLQDISEADAIAEGIERRGPGWAWYSDPKAYTSQPTTSYSDLWESINGPGSWDANPFVWVVSFRRLTP